MLESIILYNQKSEKEKKAGNLGQSSKNNEGWTVGKVNRCTINSTFKNNAQTDNSNHILQEDLSLDKEILLTCWM